MTENYGALQEILYNSRYDALVVSLLSPSNFENKVLVHNLNKGATKVTTDTAHLLVGAPAKRIKVELADKNEGCETKIISLNGSAALHTALCTPQSFVWP